MPCGEWGGVVESGCVYRGEWGCVVESAGVSCRTQIFLILVDPHVFDPHMFDHHPPNTPPMHSHESPPTHTQGGQWEKALELFDQMQQRNCKPDAVTYGALLHALDMGGQWQRASVVFEDMRTAQCRPDGVVYNVVVGTLFRSGVVWAQARAVGLFTSAWRQGHFRLLVHQNPTTNSVEYSTNVFTVGAAVCSVWRWLGELKDRSLREGNKVGGVLCVCVWCVFDGMLVCTSAYCVYAISYISHTPTHATSQPLTHSLLTSPPPPPHPTHDRWCACVWHLSSQDASPGVITPTLKLKRHSLHC